MRPTVQIPDFTDEFPLDAMLAERESARLDAEWEAAGGVTVDMTQEGMDQAAEGGKKMGAGGVKTVKPPQESTSEQVRDRATQRVEEGPVRQGLDTVLKTLTGSGLEELQGAVEKGTLGEKVSAKLLDPAGNISEAMLVKAARENGLDEETAKKIGAAGSVALGMMFPPGGISGVRKGLQAAGEAAGSVFKAGPQAMKGMNPSRLAGSAPEVQATIGRVAAFNATRMVEGRVSHAETIKKAAELMPMEDALRLDPTKYDLATLQTAVTGHFKAAEAYYRDVAKRLASGDAGAEAEYWGAFAVMADLAKKDAELGTQVGRGLEARKIRLEELAGTTSPEDLQRLAETMAGGVELGMDAATHAQRMLMLPPAQQAKVAQQAISHWRAGANALYEVWINGLLSGPQTHAANVLSNSLTAGWAPVERMLSAGLDVDALGGKRSVYFGEAPAMLYGGIQAIKEAIRTRGKVLKEWRDIGPGKVEIPPAITAEAFGFDSNNILGGAVDLIGATVRSPSSVLMTEDAFYKGVNYRMQLYANAWREASQEGLTGKAFWQRVRDIVNDPPPSVKMDADNFAALQTFNREFSDLGGIGTAGEAVTKLANLPGGRLILPFIRTPANILHFSAERVPVLNLAMESVRGQMFKGGPEGAAARAKLAGGMGVSAVVASYAMAPVNAEAPTPYLTMITGEGPKDSRMRAQLMAQGWQPYSIWNPATSSYVSYRRTDPMGTVFGIVATYAEIAGQVDEAGASELAMAAGLATSKAMLSKTFLTGLSDFLDSMEGNTGDINRFFNGLARSGVPAMVRQTMRILDPIRKDVDTLFDHWRSGLPGYGGPPMHNLWGDEIMLSGGLGPDLVSPLYDSELKPDPVTDWLVQNKVVISGAPKAVGGTAAGETPYIRTEPEKPVKLTKEERQRLQVLIGKGGEAPQDYGDLGPLDGTPTLKAAIAEIIQGSGTDGPGGSKASMIQSYVNGRKQAAIRQLRRESPELDRELTRREEERVRQKVEQPAAQPQPGGAIQNLLKSLGR